MRSIFIFVIARLLSHEMGSTSSAAFWITMAYYSIALQPLVEGASRYRLAIEENA